MRATSSTTSDRPLQERQICGDRGRRIHIVRITVISTANPFAASIVVAARRPNVEYQLDHIDGAFLMTPTTARRTSKSCASRTARWAPAVDGVHSHQRFRFHRIPRAVQNNLVVVQRSGGLRRLRVMDLKRAAHHSTSLSRAGVRCLANGQRRVRFGYTEVRLPVDGDAAIHL